MSQKCLDWYQNDLQDQYSTYVGQYKDENGNCVIGYLSNGAVTSDCSSLNNNGAMTLQQGCQYVDSQDNACTTACAENFTQRRENYTPCCRPQPYVPVSQTWGIQKPYTL